MTITEISPREERYAHFLSVFGRNHGGSQRAIAQSVICIWLAVFAFIVAGSLSMSFHVGTAAELAIALCFAAPFVISLLVVAFLWLRVVYALTLCLVLGLLPVGIGVLQAH